MKILVPTSLGELYDKISILEIKLANIDSIKKKFNISNEYNQLKKISEKYPIDDNLYDQLKTINQKLWNIEDEIRDEEIAGNFGKNFINLARSVYFTNDQRSKLKKEINIKYGSDLIEEKSYKKY